MTEKVAIKAGYRLTITTWENDGDNYQTKIQDGILDINLIKFYCELCQLHNSRDGSGFGNLYDPGPRQIAQYHVAIDALIMKYPDVEIYPGQTITEADELSDKCSDLGLMGAEFFTRVFDSLKVEYSPVDIIVDDITDQFKV